MADPPTAFPTIGEQAAATDASTDPEPRPIDVMDSLCMECGKNASTLHLPARSHS
jgi:hypothetical protein